MIFSKAAAAILLCGAAIAPAAATIVPVATKGVAFSDFNIATQGDLLASKSTTDQGLTFAGITNLAVYRNTLGSLDFYYQFQRTGAGTTADDAIETITGGSFMNYIVDALFSDADIDGSGIFKASTNIGAPATAERNFSGSVVGVDFASTNPVADNEISSTYIFRTNATQFSPGTFGVIDGSTISGTGYQPASAVPEISTWAMMLMGFGGLGAVMRSRRGRAGVAMRSHLGMNG